MTCKIIYIIILVSFIPAYTQVNNSHVKNHPPITIKSLALFEDTVHSKEIGLMKTNAIIDIELIRLKINRIKNNISNKSFKKIDSVIIDVICDTIKIKKNE